MTKHPITPPSLAIIKKWIVTNGLTVSIAEASAIASLASRLGADQELEACVEWMAERYGEESHAMGLLRAARRPKPPSLKEQALKALTKIEDNEATYLDSSVIRRALEALDD